MIEKKEEHLQKKIDQELKIAKANARANETQLEQLRGQQLQLEMQVNTLESANLNAETMAAMKKAADVLQQIHSGMRVPVCSLHHTCVIDAGLEQVGRQG
ncbi:hypothetical protein B0H13DRAFT_2332057 [Mycena leptocephala]|nr:hypothetical protein B0H13DRAFT_2332057 [Mycena leptocephala]